MYGKMSNTVDYIKRCSTTLISIFSYQWKQGVCSFNKIYFKLFKNYFRKVGIKRVGLMILNLKRENATK